MKHRLKYIKWLRIILFGCKMKFTYILLNILLYFPSSLKNYWYLINDSFFKIIFYLDWKIRETIYVWLYVRIIRRCSK
jgi:hypothetical protein